MYFRLESKDILPKGVGILATNRINTLTAARAPPVGIIVIHIPLTCAIHSIAGMDYQTLGKFGSRCGGRNVYCK